MLSTNLLFLIQSLAMLITNLAMAGSLTAQQQLMTFNRQPNAPPPHIAILSHSHHTDNLNNPYTQATHALLLDLRQQMLNRAFKFDEHFRTLLSSSKLNLHNMFADTYGQMYEQNTEIFTSMYESLEQYYATGQISLTKSMENFFDKLYQKIFQVYNSNRAFTSEYLQCATEQVAHLRPFKDAPEKLIDEIRHAFVAARIFNQALSSGIDVIKNIISLGQPKQCTDLIHEKLMKHASQNGSMAPCPGFCEQVIARCVGTWNLGKINEGWKLYVLALGELAKKLSGHYNIETIIAPLDVQISEAIMNFQENAQNISAQVFQACSGPGASGSMAVSALGHSAQLNSKLRPHNRLGKRAALNQRARHGPSTFHQGNSDYLSTFDDHLTMRNKNTAGRSSLPLEERASGVIGPTSRMSTGLFNAGNLPLANAKRRPVLIDEIREFILATKLFWSNLPNSVCTNNSIYWQNQQQQPSRKPPHCFQESLGIPDNNYDLRYQMEIQQQADRLSLAHSRINDALRGVEVDWLGGPNGLATSSVSSAATGPNLQKTPPLLPNPIVVPSPPPPPPQISSPTTSGDDEADDEDESIETGSGDAPDSPLNNSSDDNTTPDESDYPDGDDPVIDPPSEGDDDIGTSTSNNDNNSDSDDSTTPLPSTGDSSGGEQPATSPDNSLDPIGDQQTKGPVNLNISNDLITAPDAQKSAANCHHSKCLSVIFEFRLLFLLLTLSFTTIITNIRRAA